MAVDFIEDIYQYANLISELRQVVQYIRLDDDHHAVMRADGLFQEMCALCKKAIETGFGRANLLWKNIMRFKESDDLILMGDILENDILPLMEAWMQSLGRISQEVDEDYLLESSDSGFLTMKSLRNNLYIHSKNNPMDAARQYVTANYDVTKNTYSVFGCGLGYHVYQLYKASNGSVPIAVYESNPRVVEYAREYGVLDWIPDEVLTVVSGDCVLAFLESINNSTTGSLFHMPSIKQMENEFEREVIMGVCIPVKTKNALGKDVSINCWRNIQRQLPEVTKLRAKEELGDVVVVAAGPSLDNVVENLRQWQGKKKIICVGTVFRKLIDLGIHPDCVVIFDPQERTLKQIDGVESEMVPMILGVTAYWEFAQKYQGQKYIVYTRVDDEAVERCVSTVADEVWPSGSTVSWLALEVAIRLGAKRVYLAGVDLAFPGGISHASGTLDRTRKNTDNLDEVCGVGGVTVYSNRIFELYRKQMEEQIADNPQITFYNLSQIGARINGTIELSEAEIANIVNE